MDDQRRAAMVADLGHVYGVRIAEVRAWLATRELGLSDDQRATLLRLRDAMEAAGDEIGTEATCEQLRAMRRAEYEPPTLEGAACGTLETDRPTLDGSPPRAAYDSTYGTCAPAAEQGALFHAPQTVNRAAAPMPGQTSLYDEQDARDVIARAEAEGWGREPSFAPAYEVYLLEDAEEAREWLALPAEDRPR